MCIKAYGKGWNDAAMGRPFTPPAWPASADYAAGYYDATSS